MASPSPTPILYQNLDLLSNSELLPWPSSLGPRLRVLSRGGPLQGLPASYSPTAASGFPTVARRETERTKARCGWSTTCRGGLCASETQCWLCCQWALLWVLCWSGWKGLAVLPEGAPCMALPRWLRSGSLVQCPLWKHDQDITSPDQLWPGRVRHCLGAPGAREHRSHPPRCSSSW